MSKKGNEPKRTKQPWPTKAVMEQVYKLKLWGDNQTEFYSGAGSHEPEIVEPYVSLVKSFLQAFEEPLTLVDLGCGDFNVGKELVKYTKRYIGVDIVEDLIAYNQEKFQAKNLAFHCLDLATANLPSGDCALLRQVLQHLSNAEIQSILPKLSNFKYIIVTEHLPEGDFVPNQDILSGQGIRLKKKSGLNLLAEPFNFKVSAAKELLTYNLKNGKGRIVTMLYQIA